MKLEYTEVMLIIVTHSSLRHNYVSVILYACRYTLLAANANPDILPNITLGLIQLDDCGRDMGALAQSLRFIPIVDGNKTTDIHGNYNGTDPYQRGEYVI